MYNTILTDCVHLLDTKERDFSTDELADNLLVRCELCQERVLRLHQSCMAAHCNISSSINTTIITCIVNKLHCNHYQTQLSLYHNCDSTTIGLRYDDTTMHSTTTEEIEITICVRFDCYTTTTKK